MSNQNGSPTSAELIQYLKSYANRSGGKLPPVRELADEFGSVHSNAHRWLENLVTDGHIEILPADHRRGVRFLR